MTFHTKKFEVDTSRFAQKVGTFRQKMALLVVSYEECYSKFFVAPTFRALLENCLRLDLNTCVRRLVTKNGEFEGPRKQIFNAKKLM